MVQASRKPRIRSPVLNRMMLRCMNKRAAATASPQVLSPRLLSSPAVRHPKFQRSFWCYFLVPSVICSTGRQEKARNWFQLVQISNRLLDLLHRNRGAGPCELKKIARAPSSSPIQWRADRTLHTIAQIRLLLFNLNKYYVIRGVTHCFLWGLTGCRGRCKEIAAVRGCRSPHVSTAARLQLERVSPHFPSQMTILSYDISIT